MKLLSVREEVESLRIRKSILIPYRASMNRVSDSELDDLTTSCPWDIIDREDNRCHGQPSDPNKALAAVLWREAYLSDLYPERNGCGHGTLEYRASRR